MSFYSYIAKDIALDENGDLLILNGDFVVLPSDDMHIEHIMRSAKGEWREHPAIGVAILKYLNSTGQIDDRVGLLQSIRRQLEYDNFDIRILEVVKPNHVRVEAKKLQ